MTKSFAFSVLRVVVCSMLVLALIGAAFAGRPFQRESQPGTGEAVPASRPLTQGHTPPAAAAPVQTPPAIPLTVNTTIDLVAADPNACQNNVAGQCSLRQAIIEANARAGVDTIMVPAGTYQLTLADSGADAHDATQGELSITDGVNIIGDVDGGGQPATIIQACDATPSAAATVCPDANGITGKIFSINPNRDKAFDTRLTNLEIRFGMNLGSFTTDGSGGGIEWDGSSTLNSRAGTLTITNCNIHDNVVTDGWGGGLALKNSSTASGTLVTITNSTIANNVAHRASPDSGMGAGIFLGPDTSMIMSNSKVLNNSALDANSSGAGIAIQAPTAGQPAPDYQIHGSTISGNHAALDGGGIFTSANLNIDQGTVIGNNTAGRNGGGLWSNILNLPAVQQVTLSKVTITGNTATADGGGIHVDSGNASSGNNLTISFSRLANNSGATGGNLGNVAGVVTATNNWWGANSPAGGINDPASAVTFDPFIVLTHTASPNPAGVNRTSTLTADMSADNHGNGADLSGNLDVLNGLPVTFNNAVLGTIAESQPEALNPGAQATATSNAGPGAGAGSADVTVDQQTVTAPVTLVVAAPPVISTLFLPDTVTVNGTILLSIVIINPNSDPNPEVTLTGLQFTDSLPAGVVVASPNQLSNNCGGTVTADPGSSSISLSGGSLGPAVQLRPQPKQPVVRLQPAASGACFISVQVQANTVGVKNNTTGPASANESGPGAPSNTASLNVIATPLVLPPTASKVFGGAFIAVNGSTSLTFNLANPNSSTSLTNVSLTDALPGGLVVATPSGLTSSCVGNISAVAGSGTIGLTGVSLGGNSSCSFSVNVTATSGGSKLNTTSPVTATFDDGTGAFRLITGGSASASILVVLPPSISKAFSPALIAPAGVSTLSFTIANPAINPVSATGVAFSDLLPANMVVATPNGATGDCGGGTLTAASGSSNISLTGGTIAIGGFCVVSVNVTSAVTGVYTNTSGPVSSTNGGDGNTASAVLTVKRANLTITKTHEGDFHRRESGIYTITVSNDPGAGPTIGVVTVTDTLPGVNHTLVATAIGGPGWTCNLGGLICTRSDALAPGGSYPAITLTVDVPQNITANVVNTATVSGGGDLNAHTAYDPTHIGPPINLAK